MEREREMEREMESKEKWATNTSTDRVEGWGKLRLNRPLVVTNSSEI
jgi:hypothetical protein